MSNASRPVLIRKIIPKNFLSFGAANNGIELQALNVLIGPSGSGKSNLIEAVSLMRSTLKDIRDVLLEGGGISDWIWKGKPKDPASIDFIFDDPSDPIPLRHSLRLRAVAQSFALEDERVEREHPRPGEKDVYFYYRYGHGSPVINTSNHGKRGLARESLEPDRSILVQRRDPDAYPELAWLAQNYEQIRIYREWVFGRNAVFRKPQQAADRNDRLNEDFSNLGLFLNRLKTRFPSAKREILKGLTDLYDGIQDFEVLIEGGTVQVFFTEGNFAIPATRLSDGTLRYLCLLAILCDPEPPSLVCIEEPELGLHPDVLPKLADLLKSASERTQIIVTTHSDILVDAMTESPDAVVVCSKDTFQVSLGR